MILGLCDRWKKTPDEILSQRAERLLRLLTIERLGTPQEQATPDDLPFEVPYGE
ncbi:MAG TPA: hypothetical protein VE465_02055 [Streptosporangiaceae bacterium]|jgi:hypothetical protein|nr:hypothetical protein [Streptosporangiaceae bacterium]